VCVVGGVISAEDTGHDVGDGRSVLWAVSSRLRTQGAGWATGGVGRGRCHLG
jgi:hypothetical protein